MPIQVIGITSNGYFNVKVAENTYYVTGIGLSDKSITTTTIVSEQPVANDLLSKIANVKVQFPEGTQVAINTAPINAILDVWQNYIYAQGDKISSSITHGN